jgi:large subunit ribosomal protein L35
MPKLKTKKGVAKRFRLTKRGKVKYPASGKGHLMSSKTTKRLRGMRKSKLLERRQEIKYLKRMLPYG